jgi:hypothetical protein
VGIRSGTVLHPTDTSSPGWLWSRLAQQGQLLAESQILQDELAAGQQQAEEVAEHAG